jgi:hypothetical protein
MEAVLLRLEKTEGEENLLLAGALLPDRALLAAS